jgi:hypothetical protein
MFRSIRLAWAKAKALSVLQSAYEQPLKEPLDELDDFDLRTITASAMKSGGNAFDAAAGFMTMRTRAALVAEVNLGSPVIEGARTDLAKLGLGLSRTLQFTKFAALHSQTLREILALRDRAEGAAASAKE